MKDVDYNALQLDKGLLTVQQVTHLVRFWQEHHGLVVDGKAGPNTRTSINTERHKNVIVASSANLPPLAHEALMLAQREKGNGESSGNNAGPDIRRYRGDSISAAWCAAFVSYCYEQAAAKLGVAMPFKRSHGAKRLYRRIGKAGEFVKTPRPGDVVCWDRGKKGSWQGHIGFVVRVNGPTFWTIEGNVGAFPSKVAEYRHELDEARLVGFARIA